MWYGYIYKTTNLINGKIYIGKRKSKVDETAKELYLGSGLVLQQAIQKYGVSNFTREVLVYSIDKDELNQSERYWIKFYNSRNLEIGYNLSEGGDFGEVSWDHLPDKKERLLKRNKKIRDSLTGLKQTPERIAKKSSNWHKQKSVCCIYCKKEFKISIGTTHVRFCLLNPLREVRKHTEEHKRRIGEKTKGQKWTDEQRRKFSESYHKNYPKRECVFCKRELPVNVIKNHERKCQEIK